MDPGIPAGAPSPRHHPTGIRLETTASTLPMPEPLRQNLGVAPLFGLHEQTLEIMADVVPPLLSAIGSIEERSKFRNSPVYPLKPPSSIYPPANTHHVVKESHQHNSSLYG